MDAILILQRSDIYHHASKSCDTPLIFIEPGLIDLAIEAGIDANLMSYRPISIHKSFHARIMREASTLAFNLDSRLKIERDTLLGGRWNDGWDYELLRFFFIRAITSKELGQIFNKAIPERRIGVYRPQKPQIYYFDSFLSIDLFTQNNSRWVVIDEYESVYSWPSNYGNYCFDFNAIREELKIHECDALTHIPTSYQHGKFYTNEIARNFKRNVDLPSVGWDFSVQRNFNAMLPITKLEHNEHWLKAKIYEDRAFTILDDCLSKLPIHRRAAALQAESIARRCFIQGINYLGFMQTFESWKPHIIVTDHDTGDHGPLYSAAVEHGLQITVLPHSAYPNFTVPHESGVTAIDQSGHNTMVQTIFGERIKTKSVNFGLNKNKRKRDRLKVVCLLLNDMTSWSKFYVDLKDISCYYNQLSSLCNKFGLELLVRAKPSGSGLRVLASALGVTHTDLQKIAQVPLCDIADLSDLCISYDLPTTAGIDFLKSGSYLLHSATQNWPLEVFPPYYKNGTAKSFEAHQSIEFIEALAKDSTLFNTVINKQLETFNRLTSDSSDEIFS